MKTVIVQTKTETQWHKLLVGTPEDLVDYIIDQGMFEEANMMSKTNDDVEIEVYHPTEDKWMRTIFNFSQLKGTK